MVQVYRKKWVIHVERITREKTNGALLVWPALCLHPAASPISASACQIADSQVLHHDCLAQSLAPTGA